MQDVKEHTHISTFLLGECLLMPSSTSVTIPITPSHTRQELSGLCLCLAGHRLTALLYQEKQENVTHE